MRSCLIQLLITVAVIFALLWFGLPFGASWLATNALSAAGFTGTDTKVTVSANLPPRILLGHADRIRLTSTDASVSGLYAATIDVTLTDVELIDRTFTSVHGILTGVRVPAPNGDPVTIDSVSLDGAGTAADATLTMSTGEMESLATSQIESQTGAQAKVKLAAPNIVNMTINGHSAPGRLAVRNGELLLVPDSTALPTVTLIAAGHGNPFTFTSIVVSAGTVTLGGTIDLQSLLGL
jgi:hypothetical protein